MSHLIAIGDDGVPIKHYMIPGLGRLAARKRRVAGTHKIVADILPTFSRKLAAMLGAGMPIVKALKALHRQTTQETFRAVLAQVTHAIENGTSFSAALKQYPHIFDDLYVSMVSCGELGGLLPETVARLATFLEQSRRLKRKVRSALTYPVVVMMVVVAITVGMITFIVPVFADVFASFDAKLPAPTLFLMSVSNVIRHQGLLVLLCISVVIAVLARWKATPRGAYLCDKAALRLPIVGDLIQKVVAARFARAFAQLLRSGVPILSAIEVAAGAVGNRVARQVLLDARKVVEWGLPLSGGLVKQAVFPATMIEMLEAGEETGKVDEMLDSVASFYEEEVEIVLDSLTSLLEPIMMILLGISVGGILVSLFLPLFMLGSIVA